MCFKWVDYNLSCFTLYVVNYEKKIILQVSGAGQGASIADVNGNSSYLTLNKILTKPMAGCKIAKQKQITNANSWAENVSSLAGYSSFSPEQRIDCLQVGIGIH